MPDYSSERELISAAWSPSHSDEQRADFALRRLRRYRPTWWKKTLSWLSVGFALLLLFGSVLGEEYPDGVLRHWVISAFFVACFSTPGLYWFWRNARDQAVVKKWLAQQRDRDELEGYLVGGEHDLLGARAPVPLLPARRWWLVALLCCALFLGAGAMIGSAG